MKGFIIKIPYYLLGHRSMTQKLVGIRKCQGRKWYSLEPEGV